MKLKILVTGHNGFIGKNMTVWLRAQGHTVEGWDWDPKQENWPQVAVYDWVIHLGAVADMSEPSVEKCLRQNLDFSQWLFNQCNRHGVNLQYASTSSVYGHTRDFSEFSECRPDNPYAWSKYLFDRWVFEQPMMIMVQGFRYFNVYGERMALRGRRSNVIHKWMEEAESRGAITIYEGADRNRRDFTYVGDVCRLHTDFISTVKGSGIWNVGSGQPYTYLEIAEDIAERTGADIHYEPIPDASQFRTYTCADLAHLKKTIGAREWTTVYQWLDTQYK
jgi:ADP-L-glycero-D-manno-heptose 6-epimerase